MTSTTDGVSASATGKTVSFTYTAATGGISDGTVRLAVPSGWGVPSVVASTAGYSTASAGSLSVSARMITVSNLTLAAGQTVKIVYGSRASSGPGASVTSTTGTQAWLASDRSTSTGTVTALTSSPHIHVYAHDGS